MNTTSLTTDATLLESIKPFEPDDELKGTYLVLRIAGADNRTALRIVKRKYRTLQYWRSSDTEFCRIDSSVPELQERFGAEAKVLRASMLDISIIETGLVVFGKIIRNEKVSSDMWSFANKVAGVRLPALMVKDNGENPWAKLAEALSGTTRELTVSETEPDGRLRSVTAIETKQTPKMIADGIINSALGLEGNGSDND